MPNRKIKHIIATLVGASQQETMDVYDVDAVHKADIKNNLTTTVTGTYALDAAQGKVLNDEITSIHDHIYAGTLPNGTDLDDVRDVGSHMVSGSVQYANKPHMPDGTAAAWGILEVLGSRDNSATTVIQVFHQNNRMWTRFYNPDPGIWYNWTMYNSINDGGYGFTYRTYEYTYSIPENSFINVTADQFTPNVSTPPNWSFFCLRTYYTGNSNVKATRLQHGNGSETIVTLRNDSSSVATGTFRVSYIYINGYSTTNLHSFDESTLA